MRCSYLFAAALALAIVVPSVPSNVAAKPSDDERSDRAQRQTALALARAIDRRLTVWRTDTGNVVHVRHCRQGNVGCRKRLATLARWMVEVAHERDMDPFLLAAIAMRESGLNPFAEGPAGERGVLQLHPQGVGHKQRFVRSEAFRRGCRRRPGACQREILEIGAEHLAGAIGKCGSIEGGLAAYNSGVCSDDSTYARKVLRERQRLLELAKSPGESGAESLVD